jgi:L-iditol 2-dehydrogenase
VVLPAAMLLRLPDTLPFEDAALIEPLAVAMHAVDITPRSLMDRVVIVGAGTIGLLTLLAVRLGGAGQVIVTDRSAHRLAVARRLGADEAIDVTVTDPVARILEATAGRGADVVFEAVGVSATVQQSLAVARLGGAITWIGNSEPRVELGMQDLVTRELTLRGAYGSVDEFERAAAALAEGRIHVRPLIEHVAPLEDAVRLFAELGAGRLEAVKVLLTPVPG